MKREVGVATETDEVDVSMKVFSQFHYSMSRLQICNYLNCFWKCLTAAHSHSCRLDNFLCNLRLCNEHNVQQSLHCRKLIDSSRPIPVHPLLKPAFNYVKNYTVCKFIAGKWKIVWYSIIASIFELTSWFIASMIGDQLKELSTDENKR